MCVGASPHLFHPHISAVIRNVSPMKIIVQSDANVWGGNEKWLLIVAEGLAARGHQVVISCKRGKPVAERALARGLRVTHTRPAGDADLVAALRFAAMLRRERPDVVLLTSLKRTFWGGWAARRAGVRRVVERFGIERELPKGWKYGHAFRCYVDALIVNSRAIRERWLRSAPWFDAGEVHVIYNGVQRVRPVSTIRAELGLSEQTPLLAAVGNLERRKGFDVLLDALARANSTDAHLAIAGAGKELAELQKQARELGVNERVHWLGFRDDVDNILRGADVFALASRREGMANVMLEAMAADCLVVATDVSGVREAIGARDGRVQAGWIVPVDDADAFARALADALQLAKAENGEEIRRAEMRFRVDQWFSTPRMISEVERVLAKES